MYASETVLSGKGIIDSLIFNNKLKKKSADQLPVNEPWPKLEKTTNTGKQIFTHRISKEVTTCTLGHYDKAFQ